MALGRVLTLDVALGEQGRVTSCPEVAKHGGNVCNSLKSNSVNMPSMCHVFQKMTKNGFLQNFIKSGLLLKVMEPDLRNLFQIILKNILYSFLTLKS